jgi:hypothetical protein
MEVQNFEEGFERVIASLHTVLKPTVGRRL